MIRFLRWLLRLFYGFEAFNELSLRNKGPMLLLPNHVSWWDWLIIGVCLEDDWRFVTSSVAAQRTWLHRRIMMNSRTFPVDVNSPFAVKRMAEFLQGGGRLVLFPEGRISHTGSLMKLFDGTGFLIFKTHAKVVTAYIRGAKRLPYSRNPDRKRLFPHVSVHFSNVLVPPDFGKVSTTRARQKLTHWLHDRMLEQQFSTEMECGPATIHGAVQGAARNSPGKVILQDASLVELTYRRLFTAANVLAGQWSKLLGPEQRVGVLLPNVNAMPVTLLSLWTAGKVPAVFNYTSGIQTMLACARVSGITHMVSSRAFVQKTRLDVETLQRGGVQMVYLEDVRAGVGGWAKAAALLRQFPRPRLSGPGAPGKNDAEAGNQAGVILFTSGSEGEPKAVELTHRNVLANTRQMSAIIDLTEKDRFFNALPLFHSFGLTVGLLLPLSRGIYTFSYLSPLHYKIVPSALYDLRCTVFFGTNTFLMGYARKAHPYDFHTVRYCYAGAEKLQESTGNIWMRRFGVRVIEGYGATECSPCVSANTPMRPRHGSTGRLLPGMEYKLEPVEGVQEGGRLLVRGPNIMRGYLNPEPDAKFQALQGWYDTGDIVTVDDDGFLFIQGRLKRFAKVSGEMVSLGAIEEALSGAFPQYGIRFVATVIARPDLNKGEKLILVTNEPRLTLEQVRDVIKSRGLSNLMVPREVRYMHDIPRLGTGKVNIRELERVVGDS